MPVKTVGVMGDSRTYEYTCLLRAVISKDGMTAEAIKYGGGTVREKVKDIARQIWGKAGGAK